MASLTNEQETIPHGVSGAITGKVARVRHDAETGETASIQFETVAGTSGWILFSLDSPGREYDWESGSWYQLEDIVGCDPGRAQWSRKGRVTTALSSISGIDQLVDDESELDECPVCGGTLDIEDALDVGAEVEDSLDVLSDPIHGIGRASLSITSLGSKAIDWRPQDSQRHGQRRGTGHDDTVVCLDCGTDVSAHYREEIAETAQDSDGMQDIVQEALENPEQAMASKAAVDTSPAAPASGGAADVGMATGGAKDATNFRDNIHEGYVPHPDSLAYEGLFYDYYFDTGDTAGGDSLFYPSYSTAVTESPLTGDVERYLTVGLNSNLTEDDLERKPLNLVAVVDVSGSMSSQFDRLY